MQQLGQIDPSGLGDMPYEDFRRHGTQVVDWICSYFKDIDRYPVLSRCRPGDIKGSLPESAPESGERIDDIMKDFNDIIVPGITHWNSPRFFAYFSISSSAPAILGEMLSNALNVNGMLWKTSPSATELEELVAKWLRRMLHLPEDFTGMIVDTASIASFYGLAAARERLTDLDIRTRGFPTGQNAQPLCIYCSDQSHSSIDKAAIVLGYGLNNIRRIQTDDQFRLNTQELERLIKKDIGEGRRPVAAVATIGTTSTTSIDPVPEIGRICRKYGLWLHVDGAYGGIASIIPEYHHLMDGFEYVDSYVTNPHKWLFVPIDTSMLYFRDRDLFKRAFSLVPEYLTTRESDEVTDFMNYGVQLGRRFRSLKLWFVLRYFGREGIINRLREAIRLGRLIQAKVEAHKDFETTAPVPFSTVCFRFNPGLDDEQKIEELNTELMDRINSSGRIYISHTKLRGKYTLRFTVGNIRTTERHITEAWELIQQSAAELQ
ncbi:pyridoxal phosphate-dependent decarboxylase family protein [candidate division KSB1 bacterium]